MNIKLTKIISGGQTGADRAALDFGLEHGIPIGGWCTRDSRAEDGMIPAKYSLRPTEQYEYFHRTLANVKEADMTVIFSRLPLSLGSNLTLKLCRTNKKRHVQLNTTSLNDDAEQLRISLAGFFGVLNIAGSRESKHPGIYQHVMDVLKLTLCLK